MNYTIGDLSLQDIADKYNVDIVQAAEIINGKRIDLVKTRWGTELLQYEFPEAAWVVPNFVPEGLTILGGRPKVGKSWLILQFLKAIGTGGEIFGEQVKQRRCLYLSLEDYASRLQNRIKTQQWPSEWSVDFETKLPKKLDKGGIDWLESEIEDKGYQFVVIDTISRAITKSVDQYRPGDTVSLGSKLHSLAWDMNCPIVVIDHFRKPSLRDAYDVVDEISGSTGKTGVADTIMGIVRKRDFTSAQLLVTGRDIPEKDLTLDWEKDTCTWKFLGETQNVIADRSDVKIINIILELGDEATHTNIHEKTGWKSKGTTSKRLKALRETGKVLINDDNIYSVTSEAIFDDDDFMGNNGNWETQET